MPITATVTPNFVFKTGMELTAKMLNDVAQPTVEVDDTRITDLDTRVTTLESSGSGGGGVINGGTSNIQITTTDINGGDATT